MSAYGSFDSMLLDKFFSPLLAWDQAHFCEFGEKFGGWATSEQVSLLADDLRRLFVSLHCQLKKQMKQIYI